MLPGAFLSVHLKLHTKAITFVVPVNTLIFRSEGMQVAVVRDGKVELRQIAIGRDYGSEVEAVSGISAEDDHIEKPSESMVSGAVVRIANKPSAREGKQ